MCNRNDRDTELAVLDKGFVKLVDYMGGDYRIVDSARVSYGGGTKSIRQDKDLIDYLMRHQHLSPFEMVEFTFHLKAPIFVLRQLFRHRTHSANEQSARYSEMKDEFYTPQSLRVQSKINKQGSDPDQELSGASQSYLLKTMKEHHEHDYGLYKFLLEEGVARELSRVVLPQSLYTELFWKQNLRNLLHLLKLRLDQHAQFEIREYADAIYRLIKPIVPWALESWERHVLNAISFSSDELHILGDLLSGVQPLTSLSNSKQREFVDKLKRMGVPSAVIESIK